MAISSSKTKKYWIFLSWFPRLRLTSFAIV
nr:MAG TPA: hypothetical protein [Caudoviricetes sp.]